jgi:hypothetical protein
MNWRQLCTWNIFFFIHFEINDLELKIFVDQSADGWWWSWRWRWRWSEMNEYLHDFDIEKFSMRKINISFQIISNHHRNLDFTDSDHNLSSIQSDMRDEIVKTHSSFMFHSHEYIIDLRKEKNILISLHWWMIDIIKKSEEFRWRIDNLNHLIREIEWLLHIRNFNDDCVYNSQIWSKCWEMFRLV